MTITKANGIPKYIQLKELILADINNGSYQVGDKFHTEKELMQKYSLSYATVTHAVKDLAKEGYFSRKKSLGTFITEQAFKDNAIKSSPTAKTLYINDISHLLDKTETPLSWYPFDQIQKGIINSYNGSVKIIPLDDILERDDINAIITNPPDPQRAKEAKCTNIIINLRHDFMQEYNMVSRDTLSSSYLLMDYLITELGHKKLGFIGGNRIEFHSSFYAAYEIGLRTYSIPYQDEYVIRNLTGSELDGYKAMNKLLSLTDPPTAVFADTSLKALGAMQAIKDAGLKIPDNISIASFGHIPACDSTEPRLTTVKVPFYEMGAKAVKLLQQRINSNNENVKTCILQNQLLKRESCTTWKES